MASRFWVGGSGTWDTSTTTHWSATSGGAGGASVPTSADDVVFDANSGGGTVTPTSSPSMSTINTTGFTGTVNGGGWTLNIYGTVATFAPGTITGAGLGQFVVSATPVTLTLTPGGNTFPALNMTPSGAAGGTSGIILAGALTLTGTFTHGAGTFNTGNFSVTCSQFVSSNTNVRTLTLGSSTITATGTSTAFDLNTTTNLTMTANTALVVVGANSGSTVRTGGINMNGTSLRFAPTATGTRVLNSGGTWANITYDGSGDASKTSIFQMQSNPIVTGTFTVNGNSTVNRVIISSNLLGTARTITAAATSFSNVDFSDITGAGAGNWNLSAITGGSGDAGGNTGITFTASMACYWYGGTDSWSNPDRWIASSTVPVWAAGGTGGNALTANEASMETDASGWTNNGNCTPSLSTTQALDGTKSLAMTAIAAGSMGVYETSFPRPAVLAGHTVAMVASFKAATTGRTVQITANWKDGSGTYLSSSVVATGSDTTAGWTTIQGSAVAPLNSVSCNIVLVVLGAVAGEVHYVDRVGVFPDGTTAARVPLPQDDVYVGSIAGGGTVSQDMPRAGRSLDFTGFTGILGVNTAMSVYGSLTWGAGMTVTGGSGMLLVGRGAYTITSNGKQFSAGVTVNTVGGSYSLVDAFSTTATLSVTSGTFTATTQTVTASAFTSSGSTTRTVNMGSGAWTITGTSGSVWNTTSTGLTLSVSTAVVTFTGAGTSTITTGGVTMPSVTFNGPGGTDTLADAFTTAGTITLSAGTLDTGSFAVTCLTFFSGVSTTRTLTLGSSTITITNPSSSGWNVQGGTGLTITANTATVVATGTNGGFTAPASAFNWNGLSLVLNGASATAINNGTQTFANLTRNGTAAKTDTLSLSANIVVTGTLTLNSNSATNRLLVQSNVVGTQRTITAANVVISNVVDFQDIAGAGAATWTVAGTGATYLGDALGNSGITFTPSATQYRVNESSTTSFWSDVTKWASTSGGVGGTGRVPLPQDDVIFDNNSTTLNIGAVIDMPRACRTVDITGFSGTNMSPLNRTVSGGVSTVIYGSYLQGSIVFNSSPTGPITFAGRGNYFISSNNTLNGNVGITAPGGTYTMLTAFVGGAQLSLNAGTFDANNFNVTTSTFASTVTTTRTLRMGSGTWALTTTSATTSWSVIFTGLTLVASTSNLVISTASANARTLATSTHTYGTITYNVAGSTGALLINAGATIGNLVIGDGRMLTLASSQTTTLGGWSVNGTAGSPTTINSTTVGTQATLRPTAGATLPFTSDYLSLKDIAAQSAAGGSGTGLWYAGANSVDSGNNTGWTFTAYAFVGSGSAVLTLSAGSSLPETSWSDGGAAALSLISSASDALLFADTAPAALSLAAAASTSLRFSDTAAAALALMAAATADVRWGDSGTAALNLLAAAAALPSYADLGGASLDVLAQATGVPTWFASGAASLALLLSGRGTLLLARDIDVIFGDPKLEGLTAGAPIISALGVGGNTVAALAFGTPTVEGVTVGTPTV